MGYQTSQQAPTLCVQSGPARTQPPYRPPVFDELFAVAERRDSPGTAATQPPELGPPSSGDAASEDRHQFARQCLVGLLEWLGNDDSDGEKEPSP